MSDTTPPGSRGQVSPDTQTESPGLPLAYPPAPAVRNGTPIWEHLSDGDSPQDSHTGGVQILVDPGI